MSNFHRFTQPTYFGAPALPAGPASVSFNGVSYNLLNVIDGGVGGGGSAYVDDAKNTGPNIGTYLVAFGEDATSKNTNRGLKALAENTDYLDDVVNKPIAVPTRTADALAAVDVGTIILSGPGVFVGSAGTPNTVEGINTFVEILDENDNEIINSAVPGTRCVVTSISGATPGDGFSAGNVTLTVSPAIPAGRTYRVYYGVRGSFATFPEDALVSIKIRSAQEVSADLMGPGGAALIGYAGGPAWADATTNPSDSVEDQLDKIITDLAGSNGAAKIGMTLANQWFDTTVPIGAHLQAKFDNAIDQLARTTASDSGTGRIGSEGQTNTLALGNRSIATGSARAQILELLALINDRVDFTVGDGTSKGDYEGFDAINTAVTEWLADGTRSTLHLQMKPGVYILGGATGVSVPAGKTLIIDTPYDQSDVLIEGNTTDGSNFNVAGTLIMKGVTHFPYGPAPNPLQTIAITGDGKVHIEDCALTHVKITATNPSPEAIVFVDEDARPINHILTVKNSSMDMEGIVNVGTANLVEVFVNDNLAHRGFKFEDCELRATDNNSIFRVTTDLATTETRLQDVLFERCFIRLRSATTTSDILDGNCGAFWVDPANTNFELQIDNISWIDCTVLANYDQSGANSILLQLAPPHLQYDGATFLGETAIGRVTIKGGTWRCPDTIVSGHLAFFLDASNVTIEDVVFHDNREDHGIPTANVSGANGYYDNDVTLWGQFNIWNLALQGTLTEVYRPHFSVKNVQIRGIVSNCAGAVGGAGDLTLKVASESSGNVDGLDMTDVAQGGSGQLPQRRIVIQGDAFTFRGIRWGKVVGGSASAWTTSDGVLHVRSSSDALITDCCFRSLTLTGGATRGISVGTGVTSVVIQGCSFKNLGIGMAPSGYSSNTQLLVKGNSMEGEAILIQPPVGFYVKVVIVGNRLRSYATAPMIDVTGDLDRGSQVIEGNDIFGPLGPNDIGIRVYNTNSSNLPLASIYANAVFRSDGTYGKIQVRSTVAPIASPVAGPQQVRGVETGYYVTALASPTTFTFTNNTTIMHNNALLYNV